MKILFWILAILSIPVGLFMSFVSYMSLGLHLPATWIGTVSCGAGVIAVAVSIVCAVLGILSLRKQNSKKAVLFALAGLAYSAIVLGGYFLDDAVDTIQMERAIAQRGEQTAYMAEGGNRDAVWLLGTAEGETAAEVAC